MSVEARMNLIKFFDFLNLLFFYFSVHCKNQVFTIKTTQDLKYVAFVTQIGFIKASRDAIKNYDMKYDRQVKRLLKNLSATLKY